LPMNWIKTVLENVQEAQFSQGSSTQHELFV